MKKILLLGLCLWSVIIVSGQQLAYEFYYDHAGNRISRTVIRLNKQEGERVVGDKSNNAVFTNKMSNGETMTLFPNPTSESIRFEISGQTEIDSYVLSDISGRIIMNGVCKNSSLTLNLSDQRDGLYVLELYLGEKSYSYKIIKQ